MTSGIAQIERVAASVKTHLFLLCPNNSGSTYLSRAIAQSRHVWSLEKEGQHVFGFAGPHTLDSKWPLIWASSDEALAVFADRSAFDWERSRKAWYFLATAKTDAASVFHTKAPPFLLHARDLSETFENARFVLMVRDPYAALEGILRRKQRHKTISRNLDLAEAGARHLLKCLEIQRANIDLLGEAAIAFTYEELCAGPEEMAHRIEALVPALDDLDLSQRLSIKGTYDEPLRNMNEEQIARLSPEEISAATRVFEEGREHLEFFGYALRTA